MSQNIQEVTKQHFVPRTYLKHFGLKQKDNKYIIGTLKLADSKVEEIVERGTTAICFRNNLYTMPSDSIEERMVIENLYKQYFEDNYDGIYSILIDPIRQSITELEREQIISTVISMLFRTTKLLSGFSSYIDQIMDKIFLLCKQENKDFFVFETKAISIANRSLEKIKRDAKSDGRITMILTQIEAIIKLVKLRINSDQIRITKLESEDYEFITSDNPVSHSSIPPFDPNSILALPIDSKHLLSLIPSEFYTIDNQTRLKISRYSESGDKANMRTLTANNNQVKNAELFLLGTKSSLAKHLQQRIVYRHLFI